MMQWIYTGLVGLACGWIARALLPGSDRMGLLMTMLVGVGGAYAGAFIGQMTGMLQKNQAAGWLWSIAGSMAILLILRML
jgi:uncharacterized membrane protein YeaQ/YmgE (transglycosylase-associated protein family)